MLQPTLRPFRHLRQRWATQSLRAGLAKSSTVAALPQWESVPVVGVPHQRLRRVVAVLHRLVAPAAASVFEHLGRSCLRIGSKDADWKMWIEILRRHPDWVTAFFRLEFPLLLSDAALL